MGRHSSRSSGRSVLRSGKGRGRLRDAEPRARRVRVQSVPRTRVQRERRTRNIKRTLLAILALVLIAAAAGGAWAYFFLRGVERTMQKAVTADPKVREALTAVEPKEPFTILLMGTDKRPNEPAMRVDTIIVARIDPKLKRVWMVSVPRDTKARIPGHGTAKINTSYAGGPSLVIKSIEGLLGVPINHYAELDFKGFQKIVDVMGGVYVDVDVEIDDWRAASHSPGHRAKHIEPGYQLLDGEHALTYVRSRDYPDSDFGRMRHQQTFFKAIVKQSFRFDNLLRLPKMIKEFSAYVDTDLSVGESLGIVQALRGMPEGNLQTATLLGEWRSPYVIPDEKVKAQLVKGLLTGSDIEATSTPKPALVPSDITLTVRNGAGIAGVAKEAEKKLVGEGFVVRDVGNANQFVYDKTLVIFKDAKNEAKARLVASTLGVADVVESRGMYSFNGDVLVVVGKDWRSLTASE